MFCLPPRRLRALLLPVAFAGSLSAQIPAPAVPIPSVSIVPTAPGAPVDKAAMREAVRQGCLHAWNGYKQYAWGQDALKPLSKSGHHWYSRSLLMTPVDAYDTLRLMGLDAQAAEAKQLIFSKLDFDVDDDVSAFETTIRLVGGLLSAYELDGDKKFLTLAQDLADRLAPAFDTPTGMPYRFVNLRTGKCHGAVSNPAEIGTCILEYGVLSKHTGDGKYLARAKKAMAALYARRSRLDLTGSNINVETGAWTNPDSFVGGGIDSYLEYMLKGGILLHDNDLAQMWQTSLPAINRYVADTRNDRLWYGHVDMNTGRRNATTYGALDAFFAAALALGGDLDHAKKLQESNFAMWQIAGVEPESLDYASMKIIDPPYLLRPENLESIYYLSHYTHDEKYLRMGKTIFDSLENYCRNDAGYCALKDVTTKEKSDDMESFFFAEVLKYSFLIFDDGQALDFDKVIFNTEAHPYKR